MDLEKEISEKDACEQIFNVLVRKCSLEWQPLVASQAFSSINNTLYLLLRQWAKHRHPNKSSWWRLNKYWHEKDMKRWSFMTDGYTLINMNTIKIVRHRNLQISKNPFLDKKYFTKRRMTLQSLNAA